MAQFAGNPMVIINQPISMEKRDWNTGLCSCCDDVGICCCGLFCTMCLGCQIASNMNECCLCGISMAMRTLVRTKYHISGTLCNDWCTTMFCLPCSLCQIKREINTQR
ncbi:placenta-specific gene 8 protein-like [Carcharodon carcharias]|uniref:placenta-specific gene 8 protein-like n=1 Tax=Carcharodon carcharias TaxID=13397 RepID=UPI001B7E1F99|nr:placenta-specific gene 8 protein-like [Carcharodon carcharias]XP_041039881.1 placenta-specific gene 8 protein-like [Carcharodon carcharias]XP_041039944.1 placenta-specific gene 8 protein-like [Carcharodon carcharias]